MLSDLATASVGRSVVGVQPVAATSAQLAQTVTVTETTTVLQLVYLPTSAPASTSAALNASTTGDVHQALAEAAEQYQGLSLSELGAFLSGECLTRTVHLARNA